jgi:hypothetical protein
MVGKGSDPFDATSQPCANQPPRSCTALNDKNLNPQIRRQQGGGVAVIVGRAVSIS